MLRKIFITIVLVTLCSFYPGGCDKSDTETNEEVVVKTQAEYDAEAEAQITEENMEDELANLDDNGRKELNLYVQELYNIADDKAEAIVEQGLRAGFELAKFVTLLRSTKDEE